MIKNNKCIWFFISSLISSILEFIGAQSEIKEIHFFYNLEVTSELSVAPWTAISSGVVHGIIAQPHCLTEGAPPPRSTMTSTAASCYIA